MHICIYIYKTHWIIAHHAGTCIYMYICVYICIYIYIYVCTYANVYCIYMYIYIYMWNTLDQCPSCRHPYYMYIYVYVYMYIYINIYTHIHVYAYLCTYIYMYTYIYMHIYIYVQEWFMSDMTHLYAWHVWHDSCICVTWLIYMCDMTNSHILVCVCIHICMSRITAHCNTLQHCNTLRHTASHYNIL